MGQYTITITVKASDLITERWEAEALAQVITEMAQKKHPYIEAIESAVRPTIRTKAHGGEVHQDCGQVVAYGGALLHIC